MTDVFDLAIALKSQGWHQPLIRPQTHPFDCLGNELNWCVAIEDDQVRNGITNPLSL